MGAVSSMALQDAAHSWLTVQTAVKCLALGSSFAQHLSPLQSVRAMLRQGSVGEKDPGPYVALAYNCAHWCGYGLFACLVTGDHGKLVLVYGNCIGACLGAYYTYAFRASCDSCTSLARLHLYLRIVGLILCLEILATFVQPAEHAVKLLGSVSSSLSIFVCMSPLLTVRTVLRTRSVASMPADLAVASLVQALVWVTCGSVLGDGFVVFTNSANALVGLVNLSIILRFHPSLTWLWQGLPGKLPAEHPQGQDDLGEKLLFGGREMEILAGATHERNSEQPSTPSV